MEEECPQTIKAQMKTLSSFNTPTGKTWPAGPCFIGSTKKMVNAKLRCLKRVVRQRQLGAYADFLSPRKWYHQVDG